MRSTRKLAAADFIFVPTLISLLRNRRQKSGARELLTGYAEAVLPILGHFLLDSGEDLWVRRHIPATIARIPCQGAMDILFRALDIKDGFLRFQVIAALERIHRTMPVLAFNHEKIESLIREESANYTAYRRLHRALFDTLGYSREGLLARALSDKMKRELDRIYRLLCLLYPWKDIAAARHMIEKGDSRSRAGTLEYLDNVLAATLRKTLIPLLEDAPPGPDHPGYRGTNSHAESAVLSLFRDEDPVIASAAMHFARQHKLFQTSEDLGQILSTPDSRDRRVLEAASWALQSLRNSGTQVSPTWLEQLPAVELADQLCMLPLFSSVSVGEVFRICETGRQMRYGPGELLYEEKQVPQALHFLLKGRVSVTSPGARIRQIEAPSILAFQEVLLERSMAETIRTADPAVCLTLTMEETRNLLADNSDLVQGLFQMLCRDSGQTGRMVVKGHPAPQSQPAVRGDLSPIQKGFILKAIPVFSFVSPDEILSLAIVATEVHMKAGSDLFGEADRSSIYALLSGQLSVGNHTGTKILAGPSDVIGIYETLAGIDFEFRASVRESGVALRIDREDLFDLLSQRSALLRQVFGALFRGRPAAAVAN
jgi:CRP-like cAMP-binding protein